MILTLKNNNMKRFTKSLLTLALLVLGVSSTNAKIVKQNVTFAAEWYCNAKWDAGSKLFTWGTYVAADSDFPSPAWTFMAVNELTGDISEYTKLVLKLEDFTNAEDEELTIYFKEKKGNTQSMDYVTSAKLIPDANGIAELDLTTLDWTNDNNPDEIIDKTNIADVTIYGGARIDEAEVGSVYITEAYLVKLDAVEVNVGNAGYVSFCPNKAVELGDVTGYAAAYDGEKIVLTEVTEVPAGEGVIIKAAAGSYKLPVVETAAALAGNQLKVSDGKVKGGETVYVLSNGKKGLGFYQLAKGQTLSAGKVYIEITGGGSREFIAISNEATGIAAVKGVKADDAIYNLNGQRVGKTQKGLYIVNGKKVMK